MYVDTLSTRGPSPWPKFLACLLHLCEEKTACIGVLLSGPGGRSICKATLSTFCKWRKHLGFVELHGP